MVDKNTKEHVTLCEWMAGHPGTYTANVLSAVQVNQKEWGKKKDKEPGRYTRSIKDAITGKKNKWYGMDSQGVEGVENEETITPPSRQPGKTPMVGPAASTEQEYSTGAEEGAGAGQNKIDAARTMFQQLRGRDLTRKDIIAEFVKRLDMKESTAVSYYERIAKELGLTGKDGEESEMQAGSTTDEDLSAQATAQQEPVDMPTEVPEDEGGDPNRAGVIRHVKDAHLVYKRRNEEGTFDELWVYNISNDMKDELTVRRAILAGTDISKNKTKSEDGNQNYTLSTLGNAQYLQITGLPN